MAETDSIDPGFIGWQVVDQAGNVVDSGPLIIAQAVTEIAELLNPKE